MVNTLADSFCYGVVFPFFSFLVRILNLFFIQPFVAMHCPLWLHLGLLAVLAAILSFYLRKLLKAEEKAKKFNEVFTEKRRRQKNLQLISEKYSRAALYKATDDELNDYFNTYIAYHYARYVIIYLLPVFLIMAWLNTVFSRDVLVGLFGTPYVYTAPANNFGVKGLSVTGVFLLVYVVSLMAGFYLRPKCAHLIEHKNSCKSLS